MEQCERRNTTINRSVTFDVVDGEELYISFIDCVNKHEWRLIKTGKPSVSSYTYVAMLMYSLLHPQIIHLRDFEYWKIFHGLTVEEIRERETNFDYPPRLQIQCEQIDTSKPLYSSFEVSKRHKNMVVAVFPLVKKVTGTYVHTWLVIHSLICQSLSLHLLLLPIYHTFKINMITKSTIKSLIVHGNIT